MNGRPTTTPRARRQRGVTLIELIVVVTVVGILAAVALGSYRQYAQRAGRTEAKTALLQAQNNLERCFSRFNRYDFNDGGQCQALVANLGAGTPSGEGRYTVDFAAPITATTYALRARPRAGGGMLDDARCTEFTVNSVGTRGSAGTASVQECWR